VPRLACSRRVSRLQQPVSPPANTKQPGAWGPHGRWSLAPCQRLAGHAGPETPAVEPGRGRAAVETRYACVVLPLGAQHIGERVADLAWSGQVAPVIPVGPQRPVPPECAVDSPGDPDDQPPDPRGQHHAVGGLDDQVQVIFLRRVVHDTEAVTLSGGNRCEKSRVDPRGPKRGDLAACAQGQVHWMALHVRRPGPVPRARARPRFAPGPLALAAPARGERQRLLDRSPSSAHHLDKGYVSHGCCHCQAQSVIAQPPADATRALRPADATRGARCGPLTRRAARAAAR
jgi:hypothetical protein